MFGDGGQQRQGVMGALLGAGKRLITGESLFMTVFTNAGGNSAARRVRGTLSGKILAMDLSQLGGELVCQKDSFSVRRAACRWECLSAENRRRLVRRRRVHHAAVDW